MSWGGMDLMLNVPLAQMGYSEAYGAGRDFLRLMNVI